MTEPKKIILLVSANPTNSLRLFLEREKREIAAGLRRFSKRRYNVEHCPAARWGDLQDSVLDLNPAIVHIAGHGEGRWGLILEDETGLDRAVTAGQLAKLFELVDPAPECVILNACKSQDQAKKIQKFVPCVIGMKQEIGDHAAVEFSRGFYTALAKGYSYSKAFEYGKNAMPASQGKIPVILENAKLARSLAAKKGARKRAAKAKKPAKAKKAGVKKSPETNVSKVTVDLKKAKAKGIKIVNQNGGGSGKNPGKKETSVRGEDLNAKGDIIIVNRESVNHE